MIKIAFFDVGETLIHDGKPFPGATAALEAIAKFERSDRSPLVLGVISDYFMPDPRATEEKIIELEQQYRNEVLEPSGLAPFFHPFESRVTISSRAGVSKPDKKIFDVAVVRSRTGATLSECLFVTENKTHLEKCSEFKITPVLFGAAREMAHFANWADAPHIIAELVAPGNSKNRVAAAGSVLAAHHNLLGFNPTAVEEHKVRGTAMRLVQLKNPKLGPLDGVFVELPTEATVELGLDGRVNAVSATPVDADAVMDATNFVSGLVKSQSVTIPGQRSKSGSTHTVETDAAGQRRLVRRRYSAF